MAIKLHEGGYALHQKPSKKTVLQVKLTDSALRAIEDYHNKLEGQGGNPSIKFDGNQGVLQIPTRNSKGVETFTFLLAADKSAAVDCLEQYRTREPTGRVAVVGEIRQKITINANDDSYSATRKRMEIAKELEKNISTKVIKQPPGSKLGKKKSLHRSALTAHSSSFTTGKTSITTSGRSSHSFVQSASTIAPTPMRPSSPASGIDLAGVRNKTKPVLSSLSSTTTSQSNASSVVSKPINERVIHFLAIKQIGLQELAVKLKRGGVCPDISTLQVILQQVATPHTVRPGVIEYSLKPNLYNDVSADWPGYIDDERSALRRRQAEIRFRESRKRTTESSCASPMNPSSPVSSQTGAEEDSYSNPVRKKTRVSLFSKSNPGLPQSRSVSPLDRIMPLDKSFVTSSPRSSSCQMKSNDLESNMLGGSNNNSPREPSPKRPLSALSRMGKSSPSTGPTSKKLSLPPNKASTPSTSLSSTVNFGGSTDAHPNSTKSSDVKKHSKNSSKRVKKRKGDSTNSQDFKKVDTSRRDDIALLNNTNGTGPSEQKSMPDNDEFIRKYTSIEEPRKRDEYKRDFNAEYEEYRELHGKIAAHSEKFADWRRELGKHVKHTETYKKIAKQVFKEYELLQQDEEFIKERDRMRYLHRKLKHIKDLVLEFDCKRNATNRDFQRMVLV